MVRLSKRNMVTNLGEHSLIAMLNLIDKLTEYANYIIINNRFEEES